MTSFRDDSRASGSLALGRLVETTRSLAVLVLVLVVVLGGVVPSALAQDDGVEDTQFDDSDFDDADDDFSSDDFSEDDFSDDDFSGSSDEIDFGQVDDLLALDQEVVSDPGTYSYDPDDRRDPFRSLLITEETRDVVRERPEGIPGLLIDEIALEGIFLLVDTGVPVAQVRGTSQREAYLLKEGDQLWDGDVVRITLEEVVFKQESDDPTLLRPFTEVVKKLNP